MKFFLTAFLLLISLVVYAIMIYNGYCNNLNKKLNNQEIVNVVAQSIIEQGKVIYSEKSLSTIKYYQYLDIQDFFKANPGCCEIVDKVYYEGWHNVRSDLKFSGDTSYFVRVFWMYGSIKLEDRTYRLYEQSYFAVSNCGTVTPIHDFFEKNY